MTWFVEHIHRDGTVLNRVAVQGDAFRIGRALDNDLVLDDAHCAAHHARLRIESEDLAVLEDLGSINGIAPQAGKSMAAIPITTDHPLRIGQSLLRVRSSHWPLMPERPLSARFVWPWALVALLAVLGYSGWELWLTDGSEKAPPYLYTLSGIAAFLGAWCAIYALYGRLISGVGRFFGHLLIASCAFLCATFIDDGLTLLAFSSGWLWPLQIATYVQIVVLALTVRQHLRLADPGHWPTTRWGLLLVTTAACLVPLGQTWISQQRLSDIQTIEEMGHPRWRLAQPVTVEEFSKRSFALKQRAESARAAPDDENSSEWNDED